MKSKKFWFAIVTVACSFLGLMVSAVSTVDPDALLETQKNLGQIAMFYLVGQGGVDSVMAWKGNKKDSSAK